MIARQASLRLRGVMECPGCAGYSLWFAHVDGRAFVVSLSPPMAKAIVRDLAATRARNSFSGLVEALTRALNGEIIAVQIAPDGHGGVIAELVACQGSRRVVLPATLRQATGIAERLDLPILVTEQLLVHHRGSELPFCPNEESGLPPAPAEFTSFLEGMSADGFRRRK